MKEERKDGWQEGGRRETTASKQETNLSAKSWRSSEVGNSSYIRVKE